MSSFLFTESLLVAARLTNSESESAVSLPSSCVDQEDGYQWLKLLDGDEYPAVHQLCSNEFMVIDANEDPM